MLVLRKAMFSRELESKKVAVEGLFVMLGLFKVTPIQLIRQPMMICKLALSWKGPN